MKRILTTGMFCLFVTVAAGLLPASAVETPDADSTATGATGAYVQIGAHIGLESSDLDNYDESRYRIFFECGLRWNRPPDPGRRLEAVLIGPSIAGGIASGGGEDVRFGFGPTAVWRLRDPWRLHTMAGIARSNTVEGLGLGVQLRGSLVWRNAVALDCLYYLVPVEVDYGPVRDGVVSSLYGGVTFHGATGGWVTIASAAGFLAFVIWVVSSLDMDMG